jgi:hypothetical protein
MTLESFRAPGQRVSSCYLDLDPWYGGGPEAVRLAVKNTLAAHRERLEQLDVPLAVRHALRRS